MSETELQKETKNAWIQLKTNAPASIDLLNLNDYDKGKWLKGFEWAVYTITNNNITRLYLADTWKQAKKWCKKEGYFFIDDDPSEALYRALK